MTRVRALADTDEELLARSGRDPRPFAAFYDRYESGLLGFL
jgi:hypothetical protein